jgi:hypothetical protein
VLPQEFLSADRTSRRTLRARILRAPAVGSLVLFRSRIAVGLLIAGVFALISWQRASLTAADEAESAVVDDKTDNHAAQQQREIRNRRAQLHDPDAMSDDLGDQDPLFLPKATSPERPVARLRDGVEPKILNRPIEPPLTDETPSLELPETLFTLETDAPLGFTGPSGVPPTEAQTREHFVPIDDRWRAGFSKWDRYGKQHPLVDDYPSVEGNGWDPYNQNVLKGDYPIIGQHTFLNVTATSQTLNEFRQVPTATTPFESTTDPFSSEFFGDPNQYSFLQNLKLRFDLFHGNAAFKPVDWQVRLTPVFNVNHLSVNELAVVNPDVRNGTDRTRDFLALEEYFVEAKLADLSPDYDFLSVRAGSQPFVSDFRGFIFADTNRAVRLFGTLNANRDQFNAIFFDQQEKDTNSMLNTFDDRHQNVFIANYYRQDFLFPGYTAQCSFHYNHDQPSFKFDENNFLVRPDPVGVFQQHQIDAYYFGFAGEGHIDRFNIANAFYWVCGTDSLNPLAGQEIDIDAKMAAVELSYDRDWVRFRTSYFYASGDKNIDDSKGQGFDTILDNPNFAGGQFSYWQRQSIRLFGANLVQRESLVPDLRSSKIQGQSNFVNPGLHLVNAGLDFEVTPKLRMITNANYLWFDRTEVLEQFVFQGKIDRQIGLDLSLGVEYRPFLNDNMVLVGGVSSLLPGNGFDDLFGITSPFDPSNAGSTNAPTMVASFLELVLTY